MRVANFEIRFIKPADLREVVMIEQRDGAKSNPLGGAWAKEDFCQVLQSASHKGLVVRAKRHIIGYVVYCLMPDKIHVCNMVVTTKFRKHGAGTQMLDKLKEELSLRRPLLEIDVKESNLAAQLFLRNRGFKAISVVRNWYEKPVKEDAYKFQFQKS